MLRAQRKLKFLPRVDKWLFWKALEQTRDLIFETLEGTPAHF